MSEPTKAKDYGEPWKRRKRGGIQNRVSMPTKHYDRSIACVNAMAGIADPEAFVKAADALYDMTSELAIACSAGISKPFAFGKFLSAYRAARGKS